MIIFLSTSVLAQEDSVRNRSIQLGVFYPMGSNGVDQNVVNNFSLNLVSGINAGIKGFELSGFMNLSKGDVHGVQLAGFTNICDSDVSGVQFSGFHNQIGGNFKGLQAAGFTNLNDGEVNGLQLAGFSNIAQKSSGSQVAGFLNVADGHLRFMQLAGFMNINSGSVSGVQASGFSNYTRRRLEGLQVSGGMNIADTVDGMQIAGLINVAKQVKGVQLAGLVNICDSVDGVPFAFISIVKQNGFQQYEFFATESFIFNSSFKIGVERFYNIFNFSVDPFQNLKWAIGYGAGSQIDLKGASAFNIELVNQWVFGEDEMFRRNIYSQSIIRMLYAHDLNKFTFFTGPSLNISRFDHYFSGRIHPDEISPYSLFEMQRKEKDYRMWIGFSVGIRINQ